MTNALPIFCVLLLGVGSASGARAQVQDSTLPVIPSLPTARANWLSDRLPLRVGDIVTVLIDESTVAQERVTRVASSDRSLDLAVGADLGPIGSGSASGATALDGSSRDVGDATRTGDFVAVLSVRVTSVEPNGVVHIEGTKAVTIDGREQEFQLSGALRSQDVSASNVVLSSRLADAQVVYNGEAIDPKRGIIGKIISIFWP